MTFWKKFKDFLNEDIPPSERTQKKEVLIHDKATDQPDSNPFLVKHYKSRGFISKQRVTEAIDKVEKDFKNEVKKKSKSGDFLTNSMLIGANLHVLKELKQELEL